MMRDRSLAVNNPGFTAIFTDAAYSEPEFRGAVMRTRGLTAERERMPVNLCGTEDMAPKEFLKN